eukprot:SAG31_NODE_41560_length_275_cov_0.954545_1_plen_29_part_01
MERHAARDTNPMAALARCSIDAHVDSAAG